MRRANSGAGAIPRRLVNSTFAEMRDHEDRAALRERAVETSSGRFITGFPPISCLCAAEPAGGYLAFLGRISPEKRPDRATEIATRAGLPLKIAAKIDAADEDYWRETIEPMIAMNPGVEFVGEIGEHGGRISRWRACPPVLCRLRTGRVDHRAPDAVARSRTRARRPGLSRCKSGGGRGSRRRRGARQDPPRDAPRRDGRTRRGALPAQLWDDRRDPALRHARRRLSRAHGRHRDYTRPLAVNHARARLDRRLRRSRRGRIRRVRAADAERTAEPGMEG